MKSISVNCCVNYELGTSETHLHQTIHKMARVTLGHTDGTGPSHGPHHTHTHTYKYPNITLTRTYTHTNTYITLRTVYIEITVHIINKKKTY